jgi:hypothetical protein
MNGLSGAQDAKSRVRDRISRKKAAAAGRGSWRKRVGDGTHSPPACCLQHQGSVEFRSLRRRRKRTAEQGGALAVNSIIYLIGLIVVVLAILSFLGIH